MAYQGKQGGTAHSKAEAEEWAKSSVRLADGPADDLLAGTTATVGPGFWAALRIGIYTQTPTALAQFVPGALPRGLATFVCFVVFGLIAAVWLEGMRRPLYLAVTQDELICYRVPKMSQQPTRADLLFRAAPSTIRIDGRKDKKGRNWTVRFASRSPDAKDRLPQLTVDRSWYRELHDVVAALRAADADVQPALLDITAALTAAESPQRA